MKKSELRQIIREEISLLLEFPQEVELKKEYNKRMKDLTNAVKQLQRNRDISYIVPLNMAQVILDDIKKIQDKALKYWAEYEKQYKQYESRRK